MNLYREGFSVLTKIESFTKDILEGVYSFSDYGDLSNKGEALTQISARSLLV